VANRTIKRPDIQTDEVIYWYRFGLTMPEIAKLLRCSPRTIMLRLQKANEPRAPRGMTKKYPITGPQELKRRWKEQNRARIRVMQRAYARVHHAIKTGRLIRPDVCTNCGIPAKEKPQAAHENYYLPLLVTWLCRNCHAIWDHDHPKTTRFRPVLTGAESCSSS
jgi:hypothetical protein